jgi:hypothetical protein
MHRVNLDSAPAAVRKFMAALPLEPDGVELELNGQVVCKVISRHQLSEVQRDALLEQGSQLMRQAQRRNKGVSGKVIEREVRDAVDEVRRRGKR